MGENIYRRRSEGEEEKAEKSDAAVTPKAEALPESVIDRRSNEKRVVGVKILVMKILTSVRLGFMFMLANPCG